MIVGVTGHRREKIPNYDHQKLVLLAKASLQKLNATHVYTGMALGWDIAIAQASVDLNIPFTASIPFAKQSAKWEQAEQDYWEYLMFESKKIVYCDSLSEYTIPGTVTGEYHINKFQKRNEHIVDNCEHLLALYDGKQTSGTWNCIKYAQSKHAPILNVWNSWLKYGI